MSPYRFPLIQSINEAMPQLFGLFYPAHHRMTFLKGRNHCSGRGVRIFHYLPLAEVLCFNGFGIGKN
jgi:hypothetical protein